MTMEEITYNGEPISIEKTSPKTTTSFKNKATKKVFLGRLFAARSGDKGGNANLGVWGKTRESYAFLKEYLTADKLKELMPEARPYEVIRYDYPNLLGVNFYLLGFLEEGIAASNKVDGQAKSLGEYLRAKVIEVPKELLS